MLVLTDSQTKKCEYYIKVEGLDITQNASSQINGGNQNVGTSGHQASQGEHCDCVKPAVKPDCPEEMAAPAVKPAAMVRPATTHMATTHMAATTSSAKGQLAFTGAETSLPLTLGLLALGAGGALTLAGRRRQTATV
jgi:hypothetical protein